MMAVSNILTSWCVGVVLLLAAANLYDRHIAKPRMQKAAIAAAADMANIRASLPKWEND